MTSNCSSPGDLQEPFRWIADVTVMEAFEGGVLDLPDFYFTGDEPSPGLHRQDDRELRKRILDLTQQKARRVGIGKSTFHYLRKNAGNQRSFRVYHEARQKLQSHVAVSIRGVR